MLEEINYTVLFTECLRKLDEALSDYTNDQGLRIRPALLSCKGLDHLYHIDLLMCAEKAVRDSSTLVSIGEVHFQKGELRMRSNISYPEYKDVLKEAATKVGVVWHS